MQEEAVHAELARQLGRLVAPPVALEAVGDWLLVLTVSDDRPSLVAGIRFQPGFTASPHTLVDEIERGVEALQDALAIHLGSPWPDGVPGGNRPRAMLEDGALVVAVTGRDREIELARVDLRPPRRPAG